MKNLKNKIFFLFFLFYASFLFSEEFNTLLIYKNVYINYLNENYKNVISIITTNKYKFKNKEAEFAKLLFIKLKTYDKLNCLNKISAKEYKILKKYYAGDLLLSKVKLKSDLKVPAKKTEKISETQSKETVPVKLKSNVLNIDEKIVKPQNNKKIIIKAKKTYNKLIDFKGYIIDVKPNENYSYIVKAKYYVVFSTQKKEEKWTDYFNSIRVFIDKYSFEDLKQFNLTKKKLLIRGTYLFKDNKNFVYGTEITEIK